MLENLYTTKMSANKKKLQNRFIKICSPNTKIHKAMATIMTIAFIMAMLCVNVVMAMVDEKTSEQYIIEVKDGETILDYDNKPFVENNTVYFPLRETFEKFGIMDNKDSYINWNDGKIDICIAYSGNNIYVTKAQSQQNNNDVGVTTMLYYYQIGIGKSELIENATKNLIGVDMSKPRVMNNAPILKKDVTYVPFEYIKSFDVEQHFAGLNFSIKDKNSVELYSTTSALNFISQADVTMSRYANDTPEYTIDQFYNFFTNSDYGNMKRYCTDSCVADFFGDDYVFGMTKASLSKMYISPEEYAKSSNSINALVEVSMTPHEKSVYDPTQTSATFYMVLQRQDDGRYLINEFATGI